MRTLHLLAAISALAASALAAEPRDISAELEPLRAKYKLPACASAVVENGRITAIGATGLRRADRDVRVTTADIWHIGSCTKSMTAVLAGILVDAGKLRWDMPISETLPGVPCDPGWRKVTLDHLVTQRSGIAPMSRGEWRTIDAGKGTPREQRAAFATLLLAHAPAKPPGKFEYSNSGYGLLGAIIERAADASYEDFMRAKIFAPLGLKTAGFGAPATPGKIDQPWGHHGYESPFKPVAPGPDADYPPALGPAATVHMSIADFAKYAQWHVDGARDDCRLLKAPSFHKLHTPPDGQEYAMGWAVTKRRWAGGTALMHSGDNTMFYAVMWLGPRENTCFVAACNADCWEASDACDSAIRMLINKY